MERKLSVGSRRRWSKASRDGSLRENIAKADIRTSPRGISTSPERGSSSEPKWERRDRKRASAERPLRTSPAAIAMASHSGGPGDKIGDPGKHDARGICEMGDQERRFSQGKTPSRELLWAIQSKCSSLRRVAPVEDAKPKKKNTAP